jgi:hypothetical protein
MIVHLDHPNAQQVRRTAVALGGLLNEVVFVGGWTRAHSSENPPGCLWRHRGSMTFSKGRSQMRSGCRTYSWAFVRRFQRSCRSLASF